MNKISVLVVNINNLEYTKNCINDLLDQTYKNFNIVLIDQNSSEEGTKEYLNSLNSYKNINIIINNENKPLNWIWNEFYLNTDSEYLCYLNNDVKLSENFIDDTINILDKEHQVGIVVHSTNSFKYNKILKELKYSILEKRIKQGWDFTIRKTLFTLIPKELLFYFGDDWLFHNMYEKNYKCAICISSPIIHYGSKSSINLPLNVELKNEEENFEKNGLNRYLPHYHEYTEVLPTFKNFNEETINTFVFNNKSDIKPELLKYCIDDLVSELVENIKDYIEDNMKLQSSKIINDFLNDNLSKIVITNNENFKYIEKFLPNKIYVDNLRKDGISIVMAYHNRRQLLLRTLKSIERSNYDKNKLEIIIVNDNSLPEHNIDDLINIYNELNVKIININNEQKKWINSCIPYNIGFNDVKYDKIIIQNPETYHNGDILMHVDNYLNDNNYLSYACYSLTRENTKNYDYENVKINNNKMSIALSDGWYNHSEYYPSRYHYCAAITYDNLLKLNGFDERYKDGVGFDDNEFLERVKRLNLNVNIIDNPFVFHQAHDSIYRYSNISDEDEITRKINLFKINQKLFNEITKKENTFKPPENTYFNEYKIKATDIKYQKEKLTILVPIKNTEDDLNVFIPYIKNYMTNYFPHIIYDIVIIEQINHKPFNKGLLFNVGFVLTSGNTDYYALHDVNQLPISADYNYSTDPLHNSVNCIEQSNTGEFINKYENINFLHKHGCIIINKEIYEKVNGYSNNYWEGGYASDDFSIRLYLNNKPLLRNIDNDDSKQLGYYVFLHNRENNTHNDINQKYLNFFMENNIIHKTDGINSLDFDIIGKNIDDNIIKYKITF